MSVECNREEWYIDSGASSHMTPYSDILIERKEANVSHTTAANNTQLRVSGMGNCIFKLESGNINVNDILYVPEIGANLLSVHKMVCKGNAVAFDADGCHICDRNRKLLATIIPENGVYKLRVPVETFIPANAN